MNLEKFYIPRHLDDAPKFLFWSVDEAMIILIPIFFGIMINMTILAILLSTVLFKSWKKVKGFGGRGIIQMILYWYYPKSLLDLKYTPDASIKHYIS